MSSRSCVLHLCCEEVRNVDYNFQGYEAFKYNTYDSFYEPFSNTSKRATLTASAFKYFPPLL